MLSYFYKRLYHFRNKRRSRARFSGRWRRPSLFKHFESPTIHNEKFGKYEIKLVTLKRIQRLVIPPMMVFLLWFVWQSIRVWNIFQ